VDGRVKPGHDAKSKSSRYFFALRFLAAFFAVFRFFAAFFGTFFPSARASESPIAIACLRLLTFLLDRPLFSVPALRFFIARSTLADAFFEYFRAMIILLLRENNLGGGRWFQRAPGRQVIAE
jgi:hypothetical protein